MPRHVYNDTLTKPIPKHSQGGPAIRVAARERIVQDPSAGGHE